MGEDWPLERDIERARDGIDSFAGDGSTEREAFERVAAKARTAPDLLEALEAIANFRHNDPEIQERMGFREHVIRGPEWLARAAIAKAKGEQ